MKILLQFLFVFILFFPSLLIAQTDTVIVFGNVSTTTATPVNNIKVTLEYFDTTNTLVFSDTTLTDAVGNYSRNYINGTIGRVRVTIPTCLASPVNMFKDGLLIHPWSGSYSVPLNFTNYCFSATYNYFDSSNMVKFTSTVTGGVAPLKYAWDFGDGTPIDSTAILVSHSYSTGGPTYNATLTVIDNNKDTARFLDIVNLNNCVANFNWNEIGLLTVLFADASTTPGSHFTTWSFGDGTFGTGTPVTKTYNTVGTFNVCVTVIDSNACYRRLCENITADSVLCEARYNFTQSKSLIGFDNVSQTMSGDTGSFYTWDFDDGSALNYTKSPVHLYDSNGTYFPTLYVDANSGNCLDTFRTQVDVTSFLPGQPIILAGKVTLDNAIVLSKLRLYSNVGSGPIGLTDSMFTVQGEYAFPVTTTGTYYVKAFLPDSNPDYLQVAPVYYENSYFWNGSTGIVMVGMNSLNNDIDLHKRSPLSGSGTITGYVRYESMIPGTPGNPVPGVEILLMNTNQDFLQRAITATDGSYILTGLNLGQYLVYADLAGKNQGLNRAVLTASIPNLTEVNFTVYDEIIESIEKVNGKNQLLIFPNPFNASLTILFSNHFTADFVDVYITDVTGRIVFESKEKFEKESRTMQFQLEELQEGLYYLNLVTPEGKQTWPCLKVH